MCNNYHLWKKIPIMFLKIAFKCPEPSAFVLKRTVFCKLFVTATYFYNLLNIQYRLLVRMCASKRVCVCILTNSYQVIYKGAENEKVQFQSVLPWSPLKNGFERKLGVL